METQLIKCCYVVLFMFYSYFLLWNALLKIKHNNPPCPAPRQLLPSQL